MNIRTLPFLVLCCFHFPGVSENWSFPVNISPCTTNLDSDSVGVDSNGNAHVVWIQGDGSTNIVYTSRYDNASQIWGVPVALSLNNADRAHLSVSSNGQAIAVWRRVDSGYAKVEYAVYKNGSWSFGATIDTTHPDDEDELYPNAAIDSMGHAYAVWQVGGDPGNVIRSGIYNFSTNSWNTIQDISSIGVNTRGHASIALNNSGDVVAVWELVDTENNIYQIEASEYNGVWQDAIPIASSGSLEQRAPSIAVDNLGHAIAVWTAWDSSSHDATINSATKTSSWNMPMVLSDLGNFSSPSFFKSPLAAIGFDNAGDAIVLWSLPNEINSTSVVQARTYQSGEWKAATNLSDSCEFSGLLGLAVNSSGNAYAIWTRQLSESDFTIEVSAFDKSNNSWTVARTISDPAIVASASPSIAGNNNGEFVAVWFATDNPSTVSAVLQGSAISLPILVLPPQWIRGHQTTYYYVVTEDIVNNIAWGASLSYNIVAYEIYRNDQLIAFLPKENRSFDDHNRSNLHSDTYKVIAIDNNGQRSSPVSITLP